MIRKVKTIDDLIFIQQRRYKYKDLSIKNIIGLDIETHNGYSFLVTDSTGSYSEIKDIYDTLKFLTNKKYRYTLNFFFNIRYDFQSIIKHLLSIDKELFEKLYYNNKITINEYSLFFIPKKIFTIRKGKNSYRFYDIAQFYEGLKLDTASKLYLNESGKIELTTDKSKIFTSYIEDKNKIIEYCIHDSYLTKELAQIIYDVILTDFNFNPKSFISKADISSQYFKRNCYIPQITTLWKEKNDIFKYALESYHGGKFEMLKKGYFDYCIEYDINSAYPKIISELIDINKGSWIYTTQFEEKAYYGFYKCDVQYIDKYLSPFMLVFTNGIKYNPIGSYQLYLTQNEIIEYSKHANIDIIDGWVYYPISIYKPFRNEIFKLYDLKNSYKEKDELVKYLMVKIIMNSLYGKFIQVNPNKTTGNLFNPIYASLITSETRLKLFKDSYPYRNHVISYATDSIVFDAYINLPISNELGEWDFSISGEGLFLMSGLYTIHNDTKIKNRFRSMHKGIDLFTICTKYKDKEKIPLSSIQVTQYGTVIRQTDAYTYEDLNIFNDEYKYIDINADTKRLWDDLFISCGEALQYQIDSKPLLVY